MSSKTKKTVTSSANISVVSSVQNPQSSSTPVGSRPSSSAGRPHSPLSPTRHTRLQEKDALQNLNDRLAAYIDKVRQLESENSGLRREIQTSQEVTTREVSNIKGIYENELQDARKLLDDTSREKAKFEIELKRLYEENDDLKRRIKSTSRHPLSPWHGTTTSYHVAELYYDQLLAVARKWAESTGEIPHSQNTDVKNRHCALAKPIELRVSVDSGDHLLSAVAATVANRVDSGALATNQPAAGNVFIESKIFRVTQHNGVTTVRTRDGNVLMLLSGDALDKKTKDCNAAEGSARLYESRFSEITNKYNTAVADRKKVEDEARELAKELEKLRKLLADTRKQLEEEMLCRIDMENTVQSLREELVFKDQVFQQELQETRTRRQVEISEIDGRLAQQYEAKLQLSLQELREQQEANIKANRDEIEALYENKLKNLQSAANRNSTAATVAVEELRTMRTRIDSLNAQLNDLENKNAALSNRCRELERQLESERARHAEDLAALEAELARLRDEMAAQLREYATLMDIKISLDHEIATYRALIEGEEDRLNISAQSPRPESRASVSGSTSGTTRITPGRRSTPLRTARKRTFLEESHESSQNDFIVTSNAKGDFEVAEVCPDGKFVKIRNKSKKEQSLGGYQIIRKAGDQETAFKFHRTVKLEPGAIATVWSADTGAEHDPPRDIVMKSQKWFVANSFTTTLYNNDQEEIAASEMQRRTVSTSAQRHRELTHKYPRREQVTAQTQ
ncbi:Lamin-C [Eumeta japonica]|uniref:Lamin-C n=1 Tax=Eumeta variegata TaxID=151549 RepID=A0A4C1VFP3_EUMVA|nr:Lamin-C [Eumeta japonica]